MPENGGNGNGYGGDEEFTPSVTTLRSPEARAVCNIAIALNSAGARLWELARVLDSPGDPRRQLLLAQLLVELADISIIVADTRSVVGSVKP